MGDNASKPQVRVALFRHVIVDDNVHLAQACCSCVLLHVLTARDGIRGRSEAEKNANCELQVLKLLETSVSLNVDTTAKEICCNQNPLLKLFELLVPVSATRTPA